MNWWIFYCLKSMVERCALFLAKSLGMLMVDRSLLC